MKRVFIILVIVLTLLAIPATVFLVMRRQDLRKSAAPATTLALSPASITKNVGDEFTLEVHIDTSSNQVVATEIHLIYDPTKLEAQTITNGPLFPNVLVSGVISGGTASITVGADNTTPVIGTGTAAVIKFKALASTLQPASITFDPNTFIGALGEGKTNVLIGTTPASVTITDTASVNVPSPTSTISATSSGTQAGARTTITPVPSPSLSLSPTAAASPSAEASSSAIQILTPREHNSVVEQEPLIQGKAPPGSTVTLTIYSEPVTVTLTADANGNWSYTPQTPLDPGPHNLVASAQDPATGTTKTATTTFVVASGGPGTASQSASLTTASQSATPVSGNVTATIVLLALGVLLLATGATLQFASR